VLGYEDMKVASRDLVQKDVDNGCDVTYLNAVQVRIVVLMRMEVAVTCAYIVQVCHLPVCVHAV